MDNSATAAFTAISEGSNTLKLSGALDIYSAGDLRDLLRQELQARSELTLDLSQVDACDAAGLQIFCSAARTAEEAGKKFRIVHPSAAASHVSDGIGLSVEEL